MIHREISGHKLYIYKYIYIYIYINININIYLQFKPSHLKCITSETTCVKTKVLFVSLF